ncbi:MAG: hypothetical protein HN356_11265, partial [Calditrichaeota bacterium]|nr:hypothetical protein [Calditrichota bacterium]
AGVDSIYASVMNLHNTVHSNIVRVNVLPKPPARLRLHADPEELNVNDPNAMSLISATVLDEDGYPIKIGTRVDFETTMGHIGETSYTIETGEAFVFYYPSMFAGEAVLTATVETADGSVTDSTSVTLTPGNPNSIELSCDPLFSHVRGTCGCGAATLRATVRDANGNLVLEPTPVVFEMINEPNIPAGCTIGNEFDQSFVSYTRRGVAIATLNPGTQIGGKLIRAYAWRDSAARPDDRVTNTFSSFAIISGPPFQLDIGVDNDGEDVGGGAWALEVSARVWDIHRNPVADRIPVVFTVEPQIANISAGWTGNENSNGESVPGLAFATLIYNSINSFEEIEITGEMQTERGMIQGSWEFFLPVQDGVLTLEEPDGDFIFDDEDEILEAQFISRLIDGHQIRIEDAPFVFMSDLGEFDPEQPGMWRASQEDIFFNPEINEQVVIFRVRVDETDIVSEPMEVVVRRR